MRLSFNQLTLHNFQSYRTTTLDLNVIGLVFLKGDNQLEPSLGMNDVGKSTLWGALTWCLFGRTVNGLKGVDIRPWSGETDTSVSLTLQVGGTEHELIRSLSPSLLTLDGKDIGQEHVTALIQLSFDAFCHTVLLGQGQPLFFDLSPKDKMGLLTNVLELNRWDGYSAKAAERAAGIQAQLDGLVNELGRLQASQAEVEALWVATVEKRDQWASVSREWVKAAKAELVEVEKALVTTLDQKAKWDLALDGAELELHAEQNQLSKLTAQYIDDKFVDKEANILRMELTSLSQAKTCPTCKQPIKPKDVDKHRAELTHKLDNLPKVDTEFSLQQREQSASSERAFREAARKARLELDHLLPHISQLEANRNVVKQQLVEHETAVNPHREAAIQLKKRLHDFELDCADVEQETKAVQAKLNRTKWWIKGFKDIRLILVEEVMQELELTTNAMLGDVGLIGWKVLFDIESETKSGTVKRGLNVVIRSPRNDKPVRWECWGGGVGQRLRLVSALALSEVLLNHAGVAPSLEICDEPTRGLSTQGVEDLVSFLHDRATQLNKTIFLVDHHAIESSLFTSVVTVVKTAAGSTIGET